MLFQGLEIQQNVTGGVIMSNQTLVLQSVSRLSAGQYVCVGSNAEGDGRSDPVTLSVRCQSQFMLQGFNLMFSKQCMPVITIFSLFLTKLSPYVSKADRFCLIWEEKEILMKQVTP